MCAPTVATKKHFLSGNYNGLCFHRIISENGGFHWEILGKFLLPGIDGVLNPPIQETLGETPDMVLFPFQACIGSPSLREVPKWVRTLKTPPPVQPTDFGMRNAWETRGIFRANVCGFVSVACNETLHDCENCHLQ